MELHVGMSGFAYKEWKPGFYPADLPADEMLRFYATRLTTVEINNSFYRLPTEKVLLQWAGQVPQGFRFALKASRRITHLTRLKDPDDATGYFLRTASVLSEHLGPTLFQLPPNFKKDLPLLEEFLGRLPKRWKATFEFRHESWFDDLVYDALRQHDCAFCIAEDEDGATPVIATAGWGYLRLRRLDYTSATLSAWKKTITAQPWDRAFVFLKHEEDGGAGPALALELAGL